MVCLSSLSTENHLSFRSNLVLVTSSRVALQSTTFVLCVYLFNCEHNFYCVRASLANTANRHAFFFFWFWRKMWPIRIPISARIAKLDATLPYRGPSAPYINGSGGRDAEYPIPILLPHPPPFATTVVQDLDTGGNNRALPQNDPIEIYWWYNCNQSTSLISLTNAAWMTLPDQMQCTSLSNCTLL
jgi:hypothetical protein